MNIKNLVKSLQTSEKALEAAKENHAALVKRVGRELRIARMDANIKQTTLAKKLKCSQPYICFIENGEVNLTPQIANWYVNGLKA